MSPPTYRVPPLSVLLKRAFKVEPIPEEDGLGILAGSDDLPLIWTAVPKLSDVAPKAPQYHNPFDFSLDGCVYLIRSNSERFEWGSSFQGWNVPQDRVFPGAPVPDPGGSPVADLRAAMHRAYRQGVDSSTMLDLVNAVMVREVMED
jgi:hypothetical protein